MMNQSPKAMNDTLQYSIYFKMLKDMFSKELVANVQVAEVVITAIQVF